MAQPKKVGLIAALLCSQLHCQPLLCVRYRIDTAGLDDRGREAILRVQLSDSLMLFKTPSTKIVHGQIMSELMISILNFFNEFNKGLRFSLSYTETKALLIFFMKFCSIAN